MPTGSRLQRNPRADRISAMDNVASVAPPITVWTGELTFSTNTPGADVSNGSTVSRPAWTASIEPASPAMAPAFSMHRARWLTMRQPSANENAPATHRAAN